MDSFNGGTNGNGPETPLLQGLDGFLYGATWAGSNFSRLATNGAATNLALLTGTSGPNWGNQFRGELAQDTNSTLYGTTYGGGKLDAPYGWGTVYSLAANGVFSSLYSFDSTNGSNPYGGLVLGKDGNLYGTAVAGGSWGVGTVFQVKTNGAFTFLYSFYGDTNVCNCYPAGGFPYAPLVQGTDGNFYGVGEIGGTNGNGTIFRLSLQPEFLATSQSNGFLTLTWDAISNKTYQLQVNSNLSFMTWSNLGGLVPATNSTMNTTVAATAFESFYRFVLLP